MSDPSTTDATGRNPLHVAVRNTEPRDFEQIHKISRMVYPNDDPWTERELSSHLRVFPSGQLVAVDQDDDAHVLGMCASLIVSWDDYEFDDAWHDFTDHGMFTNHDPSGRTLYGADVMVDPRRQGCGIGKALYQARRALVRSLDLKRIRAGARLRGYARYRDQMGPWEYVQKVVGKEIRDPTLSFQLGHGFKVLAVVRDYLAKDPASQGHAALIEWMNPDWEEPTEPSSG